MGRSFLSREHVFHILAAVLDDLLQLGLEVPVQLVFLQHL